MPTQTHNAREHTRRLQSATAVLWPSFLAAAVLTTVVFAAADPQVAFPTASRSAIYTLGFIVFWTICAGACWSTLYYLRPVPDRVMAKDLPLETDDQVTSDEQ